ncbi:MAG: DNA alkylation repair protein [Eubacteriales bacterium]|jgi:3-methyladenine DNA glycosylase AlkD
MNSIIENWAKCDGFCNHSVGSLIEKFPESLKEIKSWTRSKNRWLKRAAAVSLIIPAKKGKHLADIFEIADDLLPDKDDMVQKGYGWLLKEASRLNQKEVFDYMVRNKRIMPRTALRYAIELMPKELRAEAMKRG